MNLHPPKHHHVRQSKHTTGIACPEPRQFRSAYGATVTLTPAQHHNQHRGKQQQDREPWYPYSYTSAIRKGHPEGHEQARGDTVRSRSIPIGQAALRRTASELKLREDQAMADFQDYVFFSRLLTGIAKQQREAVSSQFLQESDECLAHIIGTRNGSLDEEKEDHPCREAADDEDPHYDDGLPHDGGNVGNGNHHLGSARPTKATTHLHHHLVQVHATPRYDEEEKEEFFFPMDF